MDMKDLRQFIKLEDQRLRERFGDYKNEENRVLARTVKLGEEFGELCDAILGHNSMQREEKMGEKETGNLSDEFADVIITTLLLADAVDVDIEKALEEKIKKINQRYEK
jgi:NTP pyrophosphatase (non-canonical NTP hydrolase)